MMNADQFYSAVALSIADRCTTRAVVEWEKAMGGHDAAVAITERERKYQANTNDVRPIVTVISGLISEWMDECNPFVVEHSR